MEYQQSPEYLQNSNEIKALMTHIFEINKNLNVMLQDIR
jgi:hypothetical protein